MVPVEVKLHTKSAVLEVIYSSEDSFLLSAEYLRVYSPSAEVQGHSPEQRKLQFGKKDVAINNLEPQGHYALRITFSDGHDTGIYSWEYLYRLGSDQQTLWQTYLDELAEAGKTREASVIFTSAV